jgi:hypothetical protein
MKRSWILGGMGILLSACLAVPAFAFGWKDVVDMQKDGISEDLIIEKINHSGKSFSLDADDIRDLKDAGVSDRVISAMLRTEDQDNGDDYNYGYYHPNTRVYLGFGLYGGSYYRPYAYFPSYRYSAPRVYRGYGGYGFRDGGGRGGYGGGGHGGHRR